MESDYMTDKQKKLIDLLTEAELKEDEAKCLLYIADNSNVESKELEYSLYLRQPEASIALQELVKKGLIEQDEENKEGRGRPTKIYNLKISMHDVIDDVIKNLESRINELNDKKQELKDLRDDMF